MSSLSRSYGFYHGNGSSASRALDALDAEKYHGKMADYHAHNARKLTRSTSFKRGKKDIAAAAVAHVQAAHKHAAEHRRLKRQNAKVWRR